MKLESTLQNKSPIASESFGSIRYNLKQNKVQILAFSATTLVSSIATIAALHLGTHAVASGFAIASFLTLFRTIQILKTPLSHQITAKNTPTAKILTAANDLPLQKSKPINPDSDKKPDLIKPKSKQVSFANSITEKTIPIKQPTEIKKNKLSENLKQTTKPKTEENTQKTVPTSVSSSPFKDYELYLG